MSPPEVPTGINDGNLLDRIKKVGSSLTGAVQPKAVMGMYQPAAIQQQGGGASPPEVPGTNGMPAKEFIPTLQFQGQKPGY